MGEGLKGTSGDVLAMYFVIKRRHMCQLRAKHIIVTSSETARVAAVNVTVKLKVSVVSSTNRQFTQQPKVFKLYINHSSAFL